MPRTASVERRTGETHVSVEISLDGQGAARVESAEDHVAAIGSCQCRVGIRVLIEVDVLR